MSVLNQKIKLKKLPDDKTIRINLEHNLQMNIKPSQTMILLLEEQLKEKNIIKKRIAELCYLADEIKIIDKFYSEIMPKNIIDKNHGFQSSIKLHGQNKVNKDRNYIYDKLLKKNKKVNENIISKYCNSKILLDIL